MTNRKLCIALLCFLLLSLATSVHADSAPTDGLVLYLPFSEGAGVTAHDVSGNSNDGTLSLVNEVSWVDGKCGTAVNFDARYVPYVELSKTRAQFELSTELTVSAWVKSTTVNSTWHIFLGDWGDAGTGRSIHIGQWSTDVWSASTQIDSTQYNTLGTATIEAYVWYHVAATLKIGEALKLYVNGILVDTVDLTGTTAFTDATPTQTFRIGDRGDGVYPFYGNVDEVRVYNRALSAQEIATLAGVAYVPEAPSLTTVSVGWIWDYLYSGDIAGFFYAVLATAFTSQTIALSVACLIGFSAIYLRTKSLMLMVVLWLLVGSFIIALIPEASLMAIVLVVLGIGGLLYRLFRPSNT